MTRRNPVEGSVRAPSFTVRGQRGSATFERMGPVDPLAPRGQRATEYRVITENGERFRLVVSEESAYLYADNSSHLSGVVGHLQASDRFPRGFQMISCELPPGATAVRAIGASQLAKPLRGCGIALGMYALLAMAQPPGTALAADACLGGDTSDMALRVWQSLRGVPGLEGLEGVVLRKNGTGRGTPSPVEEVEALYRDFARERNRIAVALGEGYNSLQDFTDEEPCPDDDLDRVRRAGVYLLGYDPAIFKQTKRGRELREHLRAWVRWLAWMADRCEERAAEGWWVEGGGWEAPRGHGRR